MGYFYKIISILLLVFSITSCDVISEVLTTNYFEQFKNIDPFNIQIDPLSLWDVLNEADKLAIIDAYTTAALNDEASSKLYTLLKENKSYRNGAISKYEELLGVVPDTNADSYNTDLVIYQQRAMALARISINTRPTTTSLNGFTQLYKEYISGEQKEKLTQKMLITRIFNVPLDSIPADYNSTEKRAEIREELLGLSIAGRAFNSLGNTITEKDFPKSTVVSTNDGFSIFISAMVSRIVALTKAADNTKTNDEILDELSQIIVSNNFTGTYIKFPKDVQDNTLTVMERYLGVGASLTFTASGFKLPSIVDLGGSN